MSEQFILFSKDRPVINFSSRKADGYVIADMRVSSEFPHLMPFELRRSISPASLESWLARRISMIGKKTLACIAQAKNLDKDDLLRFVKLTHALSLNDVFWIRDAESSLAWKDANLYHNDFSDELGMIGLSGSDEKEIALASRSPQYTLDGAMAKCWFRRWDKTLLCKIDEKERGFLSSQACMEHVASLVADAFGIPCVKYWLERKHTRKGDRTACVCDSFTTENVGLVSAYGFYLSCGVPDETLRNSELFRDPAFQKRLVGFFPEEQLENMMIFDYLVGNIDRHMKNYGMLFDSDTGEVIAPAPLYDNGTSFFAWSGFEGGVCDVEGWIRDNDLSILLSDEAQLEGFLRPRHEKCLRRVAGMKFRPIPEFGFGEKEMSIIGKFLSVRANNALDFLQKMRPESSFEEVPNGPSTDSQM